MKGLLIGCGVIVLLGVAGIVAAVFYFRDQATETIALAREARAAGEREGAALTEAQCVDRRFDVAMLSISQSVTATARMGGCLHTSRVVADFCTGVPPEDEMRAGIKWTGEECRRRGVEGRPDCPSVLSEIQRYCHGGWRATKVARSRS